MRTHKDIKKQKEKTSLALIEAALELCSEEGYASLSLRSVARKAKIAPTSFYRHFRDIDELGVAMVDNGAIVLNEWLGRLIDKMSFTKIENDSLNILTQFIENFTVSFAKSFIDYMKNNEYLLRLFFQERTGSSEALRNSISNSEKKLTEKLSKHLHKIDQELKIGFEDISLISETMLRIASSDGLEMIIKHDIQNNDIVNHLIQKLSIFLLGASSYNLFKKGENGES